MGRGACLGCGPGTVTLAGSPGPFRPRRCQCTAARPPVAAAAAAAWRSHAAVGKFSGDSDRNGERAARVAGVTAVHHRGTASRGSPRALGGPRFASSLERVRSEFSVKPLNRPFLTECVPAYSRLQNSCFLLRRKSTCSRLQLSHCSRASSPQRGTRRAAPHCPAKASIPSGLLSR